MATMDGDAGPESKALFAQVQFCIIQTPDLRADAAEAVSRDLI